MTWKQLPPSTQPPQSHPTSLQCAARCRLRSRCRKQLASNTRLLLFHLSQLFLTTAGSLSVMHLQSTPTQRKPRQLMINKKSQMHNRERLTTALQRVASMKLRSTTQLLPTHQQAFCSRIYKLGPGHRHRDLRLLMGMQWQPGSSTVVAAGLDHHLHSQHQQKPGANVGMITTTTQAPVRSHALL